MAQVWLLTGSSRGLGRASVEAGLWREIRCWRQLATLVNEGRNIVVQVVNYLVCMLNIAGDQVYISMFRHALTRSSSGRDSD